MFETLNDRGIRTSQADLVKNFLFGKSGTRFNEVQTKWSYVRSALESIDDEGVTVTFLRHALTVIRGFVREADVYDRVQELVRSEFDAVAFATQLDDLAHAYIALDNPEHEHWNSYAESVRRSLQVLQILNIRPMRPLILAVATKMTKKEAVKTFPYLLSLGVRLLIASTTRSASVELPLADAAHEVFTGRTKDFVNLKNFLDHIAPSDNAFHEAMRTARVSNSKLARYYLRAMEIAANTQPTPWFVPIQDSSVINLEHVLPKKPDSNWPQFSAEEASAYVNRLGNQVLLDAKSNSSFGSASFGSKKPSYTASPYALTHSISQVGDWTPSAINDRQRDLADLAIKTWPL